jgi:predicted alpha/beta superfamily hydrolase
MTEVPWQPYPSGAGHTVTGCLLAWPDCPIPQIKQTRTVLVWLPPDYFEEGAQERRFPVLYLHDGQNVFDAATAFGGSEWRADESLQTLAGEGLAVIAVAIYHGAERRTREYTPGTEGTRGLGNQYVEWLAAELKPRIDADFRTLPDPDSTGLLGSSMGGLISLHGFCTRGDVFGRAGVMSPALWPGNGGIFGTVIRADLPRGRVYLDNGTREPSARPMFDLLVQKGFRPGADLLYVCETGARHTEAAWAARFPGAVRFLFGPAA